MESHPAAAPLPFGGRWSYVTFQLRQKLALVFIPIAMLILQKEVVRLLPASWHDWQLALNAAGSLALLAVFVAMPWVVRLILDENCELANIFGEPLPGSINGGLTAQCGDASVTVRVLEGDLNLDCKVDVLDQQAIAYRYGSFFGDLNYDPWFDLEPALKDFDVDVKDLQKVFGRDGSTCANPIPPQLPLQGLSVGPL